MKKIQSRTFLCTVLCMLLSLGVIYFLYLYATESSHWYLQKYNSHAFTQQGTVRAGQVLDRNGEPLIRFTDDGRQYHTDTAIRMATLHLTGDQLGMIGSAIPKLYHDYLLAYDPLTGATNQNAGNTLSLTIDAALQKQALLAMQTYHGTIGVYNYKTGEILCMLSTPVFDPLSPPESPESDPAYDGVYVNRFLASTPRPGSTFKLVTLQSALEHLPGITARQFECTGSIVVDGKTISCTKAHGTCTLQEALAHSCNCIFARVAIECGEAALLETAERTGLTDPVTIDRQQAVSGRFTLSGTTDYELGYAGIGLHHDLVNPCALMVYYGAIANGGSSALPYYLSEVTNASGKLLYEASVKSGRQLVRPQDAAILREYMIAALQTTYDPSRFPAVTIGAKTGTIERKTGKSDSWFAGFIADEQMPVAFVVYLEQAGSGNRVAGEVAASLLRALLSSME